MLSRSGSDCTIRSRNWEEGSEALLPFEVDESAKLASERELDESRGEFAPFAPTTEASDHTAPARTVSVGWCGCRILCVHDQGALTVCAQAAG